MPRREPTIGRIIRVTALAGCAAGLPTLMAQSKPSAAIPATAPTQSLPDRSVSDLPSAHPAVTETTPRGHARIAWNGAEITVEAGGSALPEILQKIARETGMKITGGVPDERVFGTYGPGPVQSVMGDLFEGLAVNMMLVNGSPTVPKELVLTARTGGATPPQVRQVSDDGDTSDDSRSMSFPVPPSQQPRRGFGPQQQQSRNPAASAGQRAPQLSDAYAGEPLPPDPALNPPDDNASTNGAPMENNQPADNSAPAPSAEDQSGNSNRTPEQIFEELRKRQQEQQQATPTQ